MGQRETDVRTVGNISFKSQGQGRSIRRSPSLKMNSKICLILFGLLVALAVLSAAENSEENSLSNSLSGNNNGDDDDDDNDELSLRGGRLRQTHQGCGSRKEKEEQQS